MGSNGTSVRGEQSPAPCGAWLPWVVLAAGLVVAVAGLFLLTCVAARLPGPLTLAIDEGALNLARSVRTAEVTRAMILISALGDWPALLAVLLALVACRMARDDRCGALLVVTVIGGGGALTLALKGAFGRARPPGPLTPVEGYAFPSGHALLSLCLYGFLAYRALDARWPLLARLVLAASCGALALAVSLSRIYLGVHWPTDVVAGLAGGAIWLAACILADRLLQGRAGPSEARARAVAPH